MEEKVEYSYNHSNKPNSCKSIIANAIFIIGCHKSGTSLLRSLLDGHSELFVFPKETHFFQYAGYGTKYPIRSAWPQKKSREEIIDGLIKGTIRENLGDDPYSDNPGFNSYDLDAFSAAIKTFKLESPLQQIESYFQALHISLVGTSLPSTKRIVEKSVESAEHVPLLRLMAPKSQFVHIVRNPYATLFSLRRSKSLAGQYPRMRALLNSIYESAFHLFQNIRFMDNYLVVRYEDLVSNPEIYIKKITAFLDIKYEPILIEPTVMGKQWKGNSTANIKYNDISKLSLTKWRSAISSYEIGLVNQYLKPLIDEFGYEYLPQKRKNFWPARGENFRTFLHNRALYFWK